MTATTMSEGGAKGAQQPFRTDNAQIWALWTLLAIAILGLLRTGVLLLELAPLHFDEAQYWSYGEALDWGYYSKPPMTAWLIRLSTEIFGDTIFGVRAFAPWLHGLIAWLIFASARRLFDARTGFWAALAYLTLPAIAVSSTIVSTDPPMMAAWAGALYALIRAMEAEGLERSSQALLWWALVGAAIGFGLNSKYTIVAFVGGAIGYALFSREGRRRSRSTPLLGPLLAVAAALIVWAPNLYWNYQHDFASIRHVGDNANMSNGPSLNPGKMAEFIGAQIGIFGPVLFGAMLLLVARGRWRHEWSYRLLLWLGLPLLTAMIVQSLLSRAHPNWAAPAYIALTIATVAWLLDRARKGWIIGAVAVGLVAQAGLTALAWPYRESPTTLARAYDPYKKTRPEALICREAAKFLRPGEIMVGAGGPSARRLMAVCMFETKRGIADIRIETFGKPGNHYEMASPLSPDDNGDMLAVLEMADPSDVFARFEKTEILAEGLIQTHGAREGKTPRLHPYTIARVSGYLGRAR